MAKKKVEEPEQKSDEQITVQVEAGSQEEYAVSKWSGMDLFLCKKCSTFDTLDKQVMLDHLVTVHNSEKALYELYGAKEGSEDTTTNNQTVENVDDVNRSS